MVRTKKAQYFVEYKGRDEGRDGPGWYASVKYPNRATKESFGRLDRLKKNAVATMRKKAKERAGTFDLGRKRVIELVIENKDGSVSKRNTYRG